MDAPPRTATLFGPSLISNSSRRPCPAGCAFPSSASTAFTHLVGDVPLSRCGRLWPPEGTRGLREGAGERLIHLGHISQIGARPLPQLPLGL